MPERPLGRAATFNQESFIKIAVRNLSGLAALLLFAVQTWQWRIMTAKTIDLGAVTTTTVDADSHEAKEQSHTSPSRKAKTVNWSFPILGKAMGPRTKLLPDMTAWTAVIKFVTLTNPGEITAVLGSARTCVVLRGEYIHSDICRVLNVCSKVRPRFRNPEWNSFAPRQFNILSIVARRWSTSSPIQFSMVLKES